MKLSDAKRQTLDPIARRAGWHRIRLLLVNIAAIAAFPVLAKIANQSSIFEGADVSGVVSSITFFSAINVGAEITRRIFRRIATAGKIVLGGLWVALALLAITTGADTYYQSRSHSALFEPFMPAILVASLVLSVAAEWYIALVKRDVKEETVYELETTWTIVVSDGDVRSGGHPVCNIRRCK